MTIKYEELIEAKKNELERIKKQLAEIGPQLADKIKEGNKIIYDNKDKAEKIITDAKVEAARIIASANEQKRQSAEDAQKLAGERKVFDGDKQSLLADKKALNKDRESLEKDKVDFGHKVKTDLGKIEAAIKKLSEIKNLLAGYGQTITNKINDILAE